jgi:hypothetical protein
MKNPKIKYANAKKKKLVADEEVKAVAYQELSCKGYLAYMHERVEKPPWFVVEQWHALFN